MASLHSYLDYDNSETTMDGLEESKELEDGNPSGNLIVRHFILFCDIIVIPARLLSVQIIPP